MLTKDDKRDFIRMRIEAPITISVAEEGQVTEIPGLCHDLSATGLSFSVDIQHSDAFAMGSALTVRIEGGHSLPPLQAEVKVVRSEQGDPERWEVGAQILQIT